MARGSWLVALGALGIAADANADVLAQARARIWNVSYEIYDATPGDSLAPNAYFLDAANAWRTLVSIGITDHSQNDLGFDFKYGSSSSGPALLSSTQAVGIWPDTNLGGAGVASINSAGEIMAQGLSLAGGTGFQAAAELSTKIIGISSSAKYNLVLGAGTGVRISAVGTAEAWLSHMGERAYADTQLLAAFSPRSPMDGSYQEALRASRVSHNVVWLDASWPQVRDLAPGPGLAYDYRTLLMTVSYENLSLDEEIGQVNFFAIAEGMSSLASPVPEARPVWLMLLGLLGLAGHSRIRRRDRA